MDTPIIHSIETTRRIRGHFDYWPSYTIAIAYTFIDGEIDIISATLTNSGKGATITLSPTIYTTIKLQFGDLLAGESARHIEELKNAG